MYKTSTYDTHNHEVWKLSANIEIVGSKGDIEDFLDDIITACDTYEFTLNEIVSSVSPENYPDKCKDDKDGKQES
jgi:hypothetical protein